LAWLECLEIGWFSATLLSYMKKALSVLRPLSQKSSQKQFLKTSGS